MLFKKKDWLPVQIVNSTWHFTLAVPNPFSQIHGGLENEMLSNHSYENQQHLTATEKDRLNWSPSKSPIPRELSLPDLSANSLKKDSFIRVLLFDPI